MKKNFIQIGEPIRQGKFIDWTGVQINEWKIIKKIPYQKNSGMSASNYEYECVYCGKKGIASVYSLKNIIKHDDCPNKDSRIGQVYGTLKIIAIDKQTPSGRLYQCECVLCGEKRISQFYSIEHNNHHCVNHYLHIDEQIGCCTLIDAEEKVKHQDVNYIAKCNQCGKIMKSSYSHLKRDCTNECNHITKFDTIKVEMNYWSNFRIRDIFYGMKTRCYDEKSSGRTWRYYGGKGIKICDEWLNNPKSFEEWSLSHGYADNLTIDRIDSNKDYCPENCRWITLEENTRRAGSIYIEVNGIIKNQKQWDEYLNKPLHHIGDYKLKYGMERTKEYIASLLEERKEQNKNGKE